ncbi:MAG: hypothetical protein ACFE9S_06675 [Candidatus Hermodarchaeota archaeon]
MSDPSKLNKANRIKSEYNRKLKDLEAKLAIKHKELTQTDKAILHDKSKIDHSGLSNLKAKRAELNVTINLLKKQIYKTKKEKIKKLRKL